MSAFLTPLQCEYVPPWRYLDNSGWHENDGTDRWQMTSPFEYYSSLLRRKVVCEVGFRFDKSSVPTLPALYAEFGGRYTRPAAVHDKLCREGYVGREKCDKVFLEAMQLENEEELADMVKSGASAEEVADYRVKLMSRARLMYLAVCLYTKSGLWKTEVSRPGFEPVI